VGPIKNPGAHRTVRADRHLEALLRSVETEAGEQLVRHCAESLDRAYDDFSIRLRVGSGFLFLFDVRKTVLS
jgi:hypothetical protein